MRLHWVAVPQGRLATAAAPRREQLDSEIRGLRREAVDVVVSALGVDEAARLGLEREGELVAAEGMRFVQLPMPDFGVPDDLHAAVAVLEDLAAELTSDRGMVIHCRAGIGRCSTLAASVLARLGTPPEAAMDAVSAARGIRVPETIGQRMWVHSQLRVGDRSPLAGRSGLVRTENDPTSTLGSGT